MLLLAENSASKPSAHQRYLKSAQKRIAEVERLQLRFPAVTNWIDERRRNSELRNRARS